MVEVEILDRDGGGTAIGAILRKEIDPVFDLDTFAQIVTNGW